jgi:hypothetical protein
MAPGNATLAKELIDEFRAAAAAVGQCLHLNHMTSPDALLAERGVDSRADYGWMKLGQGPGYAWPQTQYEAVADHAFPTMAAQAAKYAKLGVAYVPQLSTAWDSSPRTLPGDGWGQFGYPWGAAWHANVSQWRGALLRAKAHMATRCADASAWCAARSTVRVL